MQESVGVQEIEEDNFKIKGANVGNKLKVNLEAKLQKPN